MQMINWQQYWIAVSVLAVLYYLVVYLLFFKRNLHVESGLDTADQERDVAVQRKDESIIR